MRPRLKLWIETEDGQVALSEWRVALLETISGGVVSDREWIASFYVRLQFRGHIRPVLLRDDRSYRLGTDLAQRHLPSTVWS